MPEFKMPPVAKPFYINWAQSLCEDFAKNANSLKVKEVNDELGNKIQRIEPTHAGLIKLSGKNKDDQQIVRYVSPAIFSLTILEEQ